jgi:Zn-dependent peptidase ImmA (M78 family)
LVQDLATGQFDTDKEEELLCDIAASELLLPGSLVRPAARASGWCLETVLELSERFDASREATARRLVDLDL